MKKEELIQYYEDILANLGKDPDKPNDNFRRIYGARGVAASFFQAEVDIKEFIQKLKELE